MTTEMRDEKRFQSDHNIHRKRRLRPEHASKRPMEQEQQQQQQKQRVKRTQTAHHIARIMNVKPLLFYCIVTEL